MPDDRHTIKAPPPVVEEDEDITTRGLLPPDPELRLRPEPDPMRGAPPWAETVVGEMRLSRSEMAEAMGELVNLVMQTSRQNQDISANQSAMRRAFDALRDEMRSRVGSHDDELKDVRARLAAVEDRVAGLVPGPELNQKLVEIRGEIGELRGMIADDGK